MTDWWIRIQSEEKTLIALEDHFHELFSSKRLARDNLADDGLAGLANPNVVNLAEHVENSTFRELFPFIGGKTDFDVVEVIIADVNFQ